MNELPNKEILRERLADIHYAKRTKGRSWPKSMSPADFWTLFEKEVKKTDPKTLEEELRDFLTPEQLAGLVRRAEEHPRRGAQRRHRGVHTVRLVEPQRADHAVDQEVTNRFQFHLDF